MFENIQYPDFVDRTGVAETPETVSSVIRAHTACANTTERQPILRNMEKSAVDSRAAGSGSFENYVLYAPIVTEAVEGQWFWPFVDE